MSQNLPLRKKISLSLFILAFIFLNGADIYAQNFITGQQQFYELHPDSVMRLDPRISQMLYEPNEVLVKFDDNIMINVQEKEGKLKTGIVRFDDILEKYQVVQAEQLIRDAKPLPVKQVLTAPGGKQFERPGLHNIYRLKTSAPPEKLFELIRSLNDEPDIIYAEPNYIYFAIGAEPLSPPLGEAEMAEWLNQNSNYELSPGTKQAVTPDDPLYGQQWGIPVAQIDQVWNTTTGSSSQVIAILDTGVDWNHPDLADNIWSNPGETVNGADSDGNGFVDDTRGWDFVNNDNNPMDDNSHGTHVAGIAAARGNNGTGIAGVNWHARIMPVKVLQSSGAGNVATIVQGIAYASANGATVINMSFGSYARSLAMEDALASAYATSVLVAAAGNDATCIGPGINCAAMFPGALSFVLGVEATNPDGAQAGFSNFDQDGPVYSRYPELWNYELRAPGTNIISTVPNGGYRVFNGTSMAAPLVAGAASLYRDIHPQQSQEMLWGNFINTSEVTIKLNDAIETDASPVLSVISHHLADTLSGDGDGHPDAGETVELWFTVRNTWGHAGNVQTKIRPGEFEDPSVATIIKDHAAIGSISSYATRTNENDPFVIDIAGDLVHGRDITFKALIWDIGNQDTVYQSIVLTVQNGIKLKGFISGKYEIVPERMIIIQAATVFDTLIVKPGSKIFLEAGASIGITGYIHAKGTPDDMIEITGLGWKSIGGGPDKADLIEYAIIEGSDGGWGGSLQFIDTLRNCIIRNNVGRVIHNYGGFISKCSFTGNLGPDIITGLNDSISFNNIVGNYSQFGAISGPFSQVQPWYLIKGNNIFSNRVYNLGIDLGTYWITPLQSAILPANYYGSRSPENIQGTINDYFINDQNSMILSVENFSETAIAGSHGIVWKVLVNGADAQDEFVEPVGVGKHKFEVYFNRPMDPDHVPQITFGVRAPYTQNAVAEEGSWSGDFKVYTAWTTVGLLTGDGINRIRVSGARDPEGFEIPIEDSRFEFLIDAAGAASAGFTATPGMGKIDLEWNEPEEVDDLLGYNLYRFGHETDTTFTLPHLLNPQLVTETGFTDFDVEPGNRYYYYYKILRTNMMETDSSRVVSAIPHTADPGDANGDYNVDVLDIVSIVAYMLGQNPQPFIFEAADVNGDGAINVLDIVGVVQLINGTKSYSTAQVATHPDPAHIFLEEDLIRLESKGQLQALQFELLTAFPAFIELSPMLPGFELAWTRTERGIMGILYNMHGRAIPEGPVNIIGITHHNADLRWDGLTGAGLQGEFVQILDAPLSIDESIALPVDFSLGVFPNPARDQVTISYFLPVASEVQVVFYDMFGRRIRDVINTREPAGNYSHTVQAGSGQLGQGLVLCRMTATGADGSTFRKTVKLIFLR